jgi:hypothetical protein
MFSAIGRIMVLAGIAIAAMGLLLWLLGRSGFRGLPGDIRHESDNVRFYFPIVTCLAISALLTAAAWLGMWLWRWWR